MTGTGPALGKQVFFSCRAYRSVRMPLIAGIAALLSGCWVPPSAAIRPQGEPRVIAAGIEGEQVADFARVESVDRAARTVALSSSGVLLPACKIGRGVSNWGEIHAGDRVRATIDEVLTVYVAQVDARAAIRSPDARVLLVDPSYRLITVQYPNSRTATFKIGLHMRMNGIEAGDSVAIRPLEVVEMHVHHRWLREGSYRATRTATLAR